MQYLSVCSGIEAASAAWHSLGWTPVGFAEIEPFPAAVLAHHYPTVPNFGDMKNYEQWNIGGFGMLVGGTPCQAFSVAGLRAGLHDSRGNLTLTFCEIANYHNPEWIVWENVPGVLSDKTNAFGCLLAGLAGEVEALVPPRGKWANAGYVSGPKRSVAWRILDAQHFGVAQRRRRVFVVASARDGFDPAAVLFEREGLRRDSAPSREKGEGSAGSAAQCSKESGGSWPSEVAPTLNAHFGEKQGLEDQHALGGAGLFVAQPIICHGTQDPCVSDIAFAQGRNNGGENVVMQPMAVAHPIKKKLLLTVGANQCLGRQGDFVEHQTVGALCADTHPGAYSGQDAYTGRLVPHTFSTPAIGHIVPDDVASTVTKNTGAGGETQNPAYVAQSGKVTHPIKKKLLDPYLGGEVTISIDASYAKGCGGTSAAERPVVASGMSVRRLTPVECERLQGFPDNYTNIPWRGSPESPDGPRYRALGNSMAVPCMRWIGQRIKKVINPVLATARGEG